MNRCETCGGPLEGMAFVDGRTAVGERFGRAEAFCIPCRQAARPYPPQEDLRQARIKLRMSQRDAANGLGMTAPMLSQIEAGYALADEGTLARMRQFYATSKPTK